MHVVIKLCNFMRNLYILKQLYEAKVYDDIRRSNNGNQHAGCRNAALIVVPHVNRQRNRYFLFCFGSVNKVNI